MLQEIKQRKVEKDWSLATRRKHSGAHSPTQVLKRGKLRTSCSVPALLIHHSTSALVFPYLKITWSKNHVFYHLDQTEENVSWGKGQKHQVTRDYRVMDEIPWCGHSWLLQWGQTGNSYWNYKCILPSIRHLHFHRYTPQRHKMISVQGCSLQHWL